jgi:hypothetical protein
MLRAGTKKVMTLLKLNFEGIFINWVGALKTVIEKPSVPRKLSPKPDPLVRSTDPQIRIHTRMSRIRNSKFFSPSSFVAVVGSRMDKNQDPG